MSKEATTTARINRKSMQRVRMIAARRGTSPGVLINTILSSRESINAALLVADEKAQAKLNRMEAEHVENKIDTSPVR